jgi:carboxypeptidase D
LIGYDEEIYLYFKQQEHHCGFDLNLTYPQNGHFPTLTIKSPTDRPVNDLLAQRKTPFRKESLTDKAATRFGKRSDNSSRCPPKENLIGQGNTINGWYGCYLYDEMVDYALNCSFPYSMFMRIDLTLFFANYSLSIQI